MELSPALVLAMWSGGIAAGASLVAWWRIVGPGFIWLAGGVVAAIGAFAAAAGGGIPAVIGAILAGAAVLAARRPVLASGLFAGAAGTLLASAALAGDVLLALSGAAALGGVTNEMLLGHWYLVDPRLPRWALRSLAVAGLAGVALDAVVLAVRGAFPPDGVVGWVFVVTALSSMVLMAAVLGALRQPSYTGVMAATGLSYLAVITTFAAIAAGRMVLVP